MARRATWVVAVLVCVASVAAIVLSTVKVHQLHDTGAARNDAVVDAKATREVAQRVESAMTELWSYDYRTLDQSRAETAQLGTKKFAAQYADVYDNIEKLAPQQKAVVVAKVTQVAVQRLHGDRATAIVFLSQSATKASSSTPSTAAARLRVGMQKVGGTWKVASVTPF